MNSTKPKLAEKIIFSLLLVFFMAISFILFYFNKLDQLLYEPLITPIQWCLDEPCNPISLLGFDFILIQPLSTIIVYSLALITIGIGIYLLSKRESYRSRTWWGIALIVWGIGTLLAGTSYQALGYELKCEGNLLCTWTSLWEIFYLLLTVYSVNAMMMSQVYSSSPNGWKKFQLWYAPFNAVIYSSIVVYGSIRPVRFLISFELMVLFVVPSMLMFFVNNIIRYTKHKNRIDLMLIFVWVGMAVVMGAYYVAAIMGLTETMWSQGIWFSDNDVLHIGLILWMFYVGYTVKNHVKDL